MLIDAHAHLDHPDYKNDLDEVIERAKKEGVIAIIDNGTDYEDNRTCLKISEKYDIVKAALGIYPIDSLKMTDKEFEDELKFIEENKNRIVAIGEVGLDYYYSKEESEHEKQKENLKKFLELAEKLNKPIIIHSRNAEEDAIELLKDAKIPVIMHCFRAKPTILDKAISYGYYFTIPTNITLSKHFKKMARKVDINKLLTETDSPWLAPIPKTRNEPANIKYAVEEIAKVKGFDLEEVKKNIWINFQKLFL